MNLNSDQWNEAKAVKVKDSVPEQVIYDNPFFQKDLVYKSSKFDTRSLYGQKAPNLTIGN